LIVCVCVCDTVPNCNHYLLYSVTFITYDFMLGAVRCGVFG